MQSDVMVTSRSFDEYAAFFALDPNALPPRIIDVSAGAAGFTAEANRRGSRAVAVDPTYALEAEALTERVRAGITRGQGMIDDNHVRYTYAWYGSAEQRTRLRAAALADFLADRQDHPERYVTGALPRLPFDDDSFDLALCSHLLFTWADVFDEAWHDAALAELLRIAPEVRIFPFALRGAGDAIEFVPRVLDRLRRAGHGVEVRATAYEFQVDVKDVLVLTRGAAQSSKSR
ncbi:methyltransferase domain-containing protein [Ammonicoccus fulvus]|uniref:Methyltransferase domain-containing protein n=1 Tax=Ammonicoccus fulvus TaxID=3138240 RepID=A0ABZ3FJ62_9ACTN